MMKITQTNHPYLYLLSSQIYGNTSTTIAKKSIKKLNFIFTFFTPLFNFHCFRSFCTMFLFHYHILQHLSRFIHLYFPHCIHCLSLDPLLLSPKLAECENTTGRIDQVHCNTSDVFCCFWSLLCAWKNSQWSVVCDLHLGWCACFDSDYEACQTSEVFISSYIHGNCRSSYEFVWLHSNILGDHVLLFNGHLCNGHLW